MTTTKRWTFKLLALLPVLTLLFMGTMGCAKKLPGTEINETEDSKAIFDVLVAYRKAAQELNAAAIMKLVDKEYFETGGTEAPEDDYGYDELEDHLRDDFARTKVYRIDLTIKDITVKGDKGTVIYRYRSRAQVTFPAGDQWMTESDVNRMNLIKREGHWLISSGL